MGIFMSAVLPAILTMVISYLLGSINSSIIFTKLFSKDIREMGSGNAGTTNVLRSVGKRAAACTFAFDFIKGVLAVFIGRLLFQYFAAAYPLAGVFRGRKLSSTARIWLVSSVYWGMTFRCSLASGAERGS